ncbi:MAG: trehalose-6-phosphate synthase [bacterium]
MANSRDLNKFLKENLNHQKFVVAIQREPYLHTKNGKKIKIEKTTGGVHVLLDGILQKTGGLMVAVGSGDADADVVDSRNIVKVPPGKENYNLKRIFLNKKEQQGFYNGFANQSLWPLCHAVFVKPVFSPEWWDYYVKVNKKFANAIIDEVGNKEAFVWVNDYQLALLPMFLRKKNSKLKIGVFWHIPWPTYEYFRICPYRKEILEGLLAADFIGFHRGYHVENFVSCCQSDLGVLVDSEPRSITHNKHETRVANLPAGIDYDQVIKEKNRKGKYTKTKLKKEFNINYQYLVISAERIEYTKGIIERFKIIEKLLEKYPRYRNKLVHLAIGIPSRISIPAYRAYDRQITALMNRINIKFGNRKWQPIRLIRRSFPREELLQLFKFADVCIVSPLDDGLNLVAKEFVVCNKENKGMLVLSKFTGASKDLKSAKLINPYDAEGSADALNEALKMKGKDKTKVNREMKKVLKERNIYNWGIDFIKKTLSKYG